jgi:hypothetical protein
MKDVWMKDLKKTAFSTIISSWNLIILCVTPTAQQFDYLILPSKLWPYCRLESSLYSIGGKRCQVLKIFAKIVHNYSFGHFNHRPRSHKAFHRLSTTLLYTHIRLGFASGFFILRRLKVVQFLFSLDQLAELATQRSATSTSFKI